MRLLYLYMLRLFDMFQINAVSEISMTLTLNQLHLCLLLLKEAKMLLASAYNKHLHMPHVGHSTNIATISSTILHSDYCDSGIESVNSSVNILYRRGNVTCDFLSIVLKYC